jgi:murein DD-endopeptidase MepM/ murein hydrolase activator NlpD
MTRLVPALVFVLASLSTVAQPLGWRVSPQTPLIELKDGQGYLSCDLVLTNNTADTLVIQMLEERQLDGSGQVVGIRSLNGNGYHAGIETLVGRTLLPHADLLVYYPFYEIKHPQAVANLAVTLSYYRKSQSKLFEGNVLQTDGQLLLTLKPKIYETKTRLTLPFKKPYLNYDGHDFYAHHRRANILHPVLTALGFTGNFGRYAYDFCRADATGGLYAGPADSNASWFCFGDSVFAPADGVVAEAENAMADNRRIDRNRVRAEPMTVTGNHVTLDNGNGEFSLLAHLKQGSVAVAKGARVKRGQYLGSIGASGSALFPHLHYELRTSAGTDAEGLPARFHDYTLHLGATHKPIREGHIETGDIVSAGKHK